MSVLKEMKKSYEDYFTNNEFDLQKTLISLEKYKDKEIRAEYIRKLYKFILVTSDCHEITKKWIRNRSSIIDTIKEENNNRRKKDQIDEKNGNAQVSYDIRRFKNVLQIPYGKKHINILNAVKTFNGELGEENCRLCDNAIKLANLNYASKCYNPKDLLINIPAKSLAVECNIEKFKELLELMEPYSVKVRRNVQDKINTMSNEVGYFNYLMSTGAELSETEMELKVAIEDWLKGFPFEFNSNEESDLLDFDIEDW